MAFERTATYRENAPAHGLFRCCCCLSFSLMLLIIVVIAIALVFILALRPVKPEFHLTSASIQKFEVDKQMQGILNFTLYLSMNITLIFSSVNPNKVAINYSPTELECLYNGIALGVANVKSFHQPPHSRSVLTIVLIVDRLNILQNVSQNLLDDANRDDVPLDIKGPIRARSKIIGINSPQVKVFVNCRIDFHPKEGTIPKKQCNLSR